MSKGLSIHIGLNAVDPAKYDGWRGELIACENDANDLAALARSQGFESSVLLTADATADRVKQAIRAAGQTLCSGDILCVSYSGHGSRVVDVSGDEDDQPDGLDETWVLYDRELIDDELWTLWSGLQPGVRVLLISDSCHSRTIVHFPAGALDAAPSSHPQTHRPRTPPANVQRAYVKANRETLSEIQRENQAVNPNEIGATVITLSACTDDELAAEGDVNGAFTEGIKQVWAAGPNGGYESFLMRVRDVVGSRQTPQYLVQGCPSAEFENQRPFTV